MNYIQVSPIDLIVIATFAFAAVWHFPVLRPIGALLLIAAAITPFTSPLSAPEKGLIYLPLDVIGGITGVYLWAWHKENVGKRFLGFAIASCIAHLVMFTHPPHTQDQHWWYVATLNVLFIASCFYVGGTGLARLHRHLWERAGDCQPVGALGSGG